MQAANFCCENCSSSTATLNVHHGYYRRGAMPWEYEDDVLHCLCEDCHLRIETLKESIYLALAKMNITEMDALMRSQFNDQKPIVETCTLTPMNSTDRLERQAILLCVAGIHTGMDRRITETLIESDFSNDLFRKLFSAFKADRISQDFPNEFAELIQDSIETGLERLEENHPCISVLIHQFVVRRDQRFLEKAFSAPIPISQLDDETKDALRRLYKFRQAQMSTSKSQRSTVVREMTQEELHELHAEKARQLEALRGWESKRDGR